VPVKPWETEVELLERLRAGDETAFAALVDDLHGRLVALAATFTSSPPLAEDIVQETWLAVIRGLRAFEGRSSLRTWIFSILVRRARTMAVREARRGVPVTGSEGRNGDGFVEWSPGLGRIGLWEKTPVPWVLEDPAAIHLSHEALEVVRTALTGLPVAQQQVVLLRDVEDVPAREVCNILDLSETNQRVLLHRGRARIRRALDQYMREGARPPSRAGTDGTSPPTSQRTRGPEGVGNAEAAGLKGEARNTSGGAA
jgi:RNA polymerase sigma-70 factor, ECF subfamily